MKLSVVIPAYNEGAIIERSIKKMVQILDKGKYDWELIIVDDGSKDGTGRILDSLKKKYRKLVVLHHKVNRGRGAALKTGFAAATGARVFVSEADLRWDPETLIPKMLEKMKKEDADIVSGSPRLPGGGYVNVPWHRVLLSKFGNKLFSLAMGKGLTFFTGCARMYNKKVLDSIDMVSDEKDLHLEIISKARDLGYRICEVPAKVTWTSPQGRERRKTTTKIKKTAIEHLLFSFSEAPILLIGAIAAIFILLGLIIGAHLIGVYLQGALNPDRPLMVLMVLLFVIGVQNLVFWFLAKQNVELRKHIVRMQRDILEIKKER